MLGYVAIFLLSRGYRGADRLLSRQDLSKQVGCQSRMLERHLEQTFGFGDGRDLLTRREVRLLYFAFSVNVSALLPLPFECGRL